MNKIKAASITLLLLIVAVGGISISPVISSTAMAATTVNQSSADQNAQQADNQPAAEQRLSNKITELVRAARKAARGHQPEEAEAKYREAISLDADNTRLYHELGVYFERRERGVEAAKLFHQARLIGIIKDRKMRVHHLEQAIKSLDRERQHLLELIEKFKQETTQAEALRESEE